MAIQSQTKEDLNDIAEILDQRIYELTDPEHFEDFWGCTADRPQEGELERLRKLKEQVKAVLKEAA